MESRAFQVQERSENLRLEMEEDRDDEIGNTDGLKQIFVVVV